MKSTHYFAVDTASVGFAHIKIITNSSGEPYDIEFLHTNPAFNHIFGEKTGYFSGNRARALTQDQEKITEILESATALMDGVELNFDQYLEKTQKWIRVQLSPDGAGCFYAWITDITAERLFMQNSSDIVLSKEITNQTIVERFSKATASSFSAFFRFTKVGQDTQHVFFYSSPSSVNQTYEQLKSIFLQCSFTFDSVCFRKEHMTFAEFKGCIDNPALDQQLEEVLEKYPSRLLYVFPINSPDALEGLFVCLQEKRNGLTNLRLSKTYAEQTGMVLYTEKQAQREKEMEEELEENEEICQLITENTSDGVALFRNGIFEYVSPSYSRLLGYTVNELTGITKEDFLDMVHPEDQKMIQTILERVTTEKIKNQTYSYRIQKKDGEYIWFEDKLSNQFDEKGKHKATYINSRDITNQVYYEQVLKDSEERFREIFNNTHDAIYIHKIDETGMPGKFTMANREALKRLEYSLKELKQMTPADIDSNRKRLNIPHIMEELFKNEEYVFRGEHVTKSGKVISVENKVHLFTLKGEKMIVSISRDITEELKAQEKQRQDKALLQSVLDALPGKLRVIDRDYRVIAANDELLADAPSEIKTTEELKGHHCYQLFYGLNKPCEDCNLKALDELTEMETKIYYKDKGGKKDKQAFKLFLAPLRNETGEKIGIIEYSVDITELKNAQRNAEKASHAKTEFMMNMSHELRTPLNGIIGFSGILEESDLDDTQKEFVRNIHVSGKALLNIVSDILNYSKIETKKVGIKKKETDLYRVVSTAFEGIQVMAKNKGLETQLIIDEEIPRSILTDPLIIHQVLNNLLINAVKFTEEGLIVCKTKILSSKDHTVDIHFSVTDTGIGIADEIKEKIFESFTQADSSLTRKYGGTGLGLTISSSLLHMMNSSIDLESVPGKGSTFSFVITFELPDTKQNQHPKEKQDKQKHKNATAKSYKFLVVEDNPINLKLNRMIVGNHFNHSEVFTAENGKKAVEAFIQHRPDIIIMDIRMPGMNGIEATEQIRKIEGNNWQTKIIALSADARIENIQYGMLSGLDDYITKPVEPEKLIQKIEEILE